MKALTRMSGKANVCHRAVQAPSWGYPTETAYYRDAQSADAVVAIKIPFLAINAEDDPVRSPSSSVTRYGPLTRH
jgi:predicted alpha/beta-fold hydrolase